MKKIISILLLGAMSFGIVGCGSPSPEKTVKDFFEKAKSSQINMKDLSEEQKKSFEFMNEKFPEEFKELQKKSKELVKDLNVEILSSEEVGDVASVNVNISAVDASEFFAKFVAELFKEIFATAFSSALSGGETISDEVAYTTALKVLNNSLEGIEFKVVERPYTVELKKVDGEWVITNEEALMFECLNIDSEQFKEFQENLNEVA
ncbi:MAG: hypothetical protein ACRC6T_09400 [Sarcina sp.]